uniref:Transducin-like n=2 Tax=Oryza sativa subsp. japonica TaxID=39947 RepID=Q652X1_ORYSJ|nr:transducin-like [Oryza sativa Japonica Group]
MEDGHPYLYPYDEIVLLGIPLCVPWSDCGLMDGQKDEKIQDWKPETLYLIGIDWNKEYTNILASASADKTVKIWDVAAGKCVTTLEHHDAKVQAVAWSQRSPEVILSDYCVLQVSLENGMVQTFDKRITSSHQNGTVPMFTLHAHEMAVLSISFCPSVPNFLATASADKTVKLWDISSNQPSVIASLNPKVGAIFSISFSKDNPFLLAVGGQKGNLKVWNTLTEPLVANKIGKHGSS